jgi:hypothetical protein
VYLAFDNVPEEWDTTDRRPRETMQRVPTDEEVHAILRPWRPLRWRSAAASLWTKRYDEAVWLRTHYGEGSDEKFAAWHAMDEDYDAQFEPRDVVWTVLDDAELFDFGGEWWRVFDVLAELADRWRAPQETVQALREKLHQEIQRRVAAGDDPAEVAVFEAEYGKYGQELQLAVVASFLLVADARAWETDRLRLLYLDSKGNVIRHTTVEVERAWETRDYWFAPRFRNTEWWRYKDDPADGEPEEPGAELGKKYRAHGEQGRVLYGLDP